MCEILSHTNRRPHVCGGLTSSNRSKGRKNIDGDKERLLGLTKPRSRAWRRPDEWLKPEKGKNRSSFSTSGARKPLKIP